MFYWIYEIPTLLAVAFFAAGFILANALGMYVLGPVLRSLLIISADANSLIRNLILFYSAMLAIITCGAWADTRKIAENEATAFAVPHREVWAAPQPDVEAVHFLAHDATHLAWWQNVQAPFSLRKTNSSIFSNTCPEFEDIASVQRVYRCSSRTPERVDYRHPADNVTNHGGWCRRLPDADVAVRSRAQAACRSEWDCGFCRQHGRPSRSNGHPVSQQGRCLVGHLQLITAPIRQVQCTVRGKPAMEGE
jgi:hypothetical protein